MEMFDEIRVGRTTNRKNLKWFEREMNRVAVEMVILVQYTFELVALTLLICKC